MIIKSTSLQTSDGEAYSSLTLKCPIRPNSHPRERIVSPFLFFILKLHPSVAFCNNVSLSLCPLSHLCATGNTDAQPSWLRNRSKYPLLTVVKSLPAFHERPYCFFFDVALLLWQCFTPYLERHPDGGKGERGKLVSACHLSSIGLDIPLM